MEKLMQEIRDFLSRDSLVEVAEEIAFEKVKPPGEGATNAEEEEVHERLWTETHRTITWALLSVAMERMK